ncbi:MAG TPA: P1 family peptidase [Ktedonobacterales bacterium]
MTERHDDICDVPGILVGHDTLLEAATGCTVVLCANSALGAVDVRGGAPATRETDLLSPTCMMREVHAITLSGGSAFGLEAASGVARALEARGVGYQVGVARVPIVPAAALFDLAIGSSTERPDALSGARALAAASGGPVAQGSVGAGAGATVGKVAGPLFSVKGGIGSASEELLTGHTLGALVAVNALGDVHDPDTGAIIAGARNPNGGGWLNAPSARTASGQPPVPGANTTLGVIATNAPLSKAGLTKLAQMTHDGYALAIRPVHTPFDGDTIFALSTASEAPAGDESMLLSIIAASAARVMARAIANAVRAATSLAGVPAIRDLDWPQ